MDQDDKEGVPGARGRGRRRPPTIEGTASDLSTEHASGSETSAPAEPPPDETPGAPEIMGEPTPGAVDPSAPEPEVIAAAETVEASHASVEEPVSPPSAPEAKSDSEERKLAFVPLLAAALLGGVISVGGSALIGSMNRSETSASNLESRFASVEKSAAAANAAAQGLKTDLSQLAADIKKAPSAAPGSPSAPVDLSPLEKRLAALEGMITELGRKTDVGQNSAEITERKVTAVQQQADGKLATLSQQIVDANGKVTALAAQQAKDNSAPILAVISSLRIAIDRGRPFITEISALKALGVPAEKLEALQAVAAKGVQPSQQIAARFREISAYFEEPPVSHASESLTQRLFSSAASLVKVRPVGAVAGEDVVAVSSRVEAALGRGDADMAATEAAKLPPAAQQQAKPVLDAIKERQSAVNAVARLEQDSFAAIAAQAQR